MFPVTKFCNFDLKVELLTKAQQNIDCFNVELFGHSDQEKSVEQQSLTIIFSD